MNHRIARRLSATVLAALLATGASECQPGDDNNASSTGEQYAQQDANDGSIDPDVARCANLRAAFDNMKPTKAERQLNPDKRLISDYKRMKAFYATFAQIFPESATAANALSDIYAQAANGPLPAATENKIAGYDDKVNAVIDKHCPNSGYPAS